MRASLVACLFVGLCASVALGVKTTVCSGGLWPLPTGMQFGLDTATVGSQASFTWQANINDPVLNAAMKRYAGIMFAPTNISGLASSDASTLTGVSITVTSSSTDVPLQLGVNESYYVAVPDPSAGGSGLVTITAETVWGALHGLETFSQLISVTSTGGLTVPCVPVGISDFPRFPHRGLMLDTARHFLPVSLILRQIDGMAFSKMNTLHWHVIDAESFPMESATYPDLTDGAYAPNLVYSANDVKTVVQYAMERGIRVVPEFDVPGHAYSWGAHYDITANCPDLNSNINNVPLNPTKSQTMEIVQGFLGEMAALFPDNVMHLGGDEVIYDCWSDDPTIQSWMAAKGWSNYNQLMQYFVTATDGFVTGTAKKTITHWNDVFDSGITVPSGSIFQAWNSLTDVVNIVKAGNRCIVSNSNMWYLNCGFNPHCPYVSWESMYSNDPIHSLGTTLTPAQAALVMGGEAVLFGEFADATDVDPQVWPRAAVVGERLWSNYEETTSATSAQPRLIVHRCRLVQRGIAASPIGPGFCGLVV